TYDGFTETVSLPLTVYFDRLTSTSKNLSHCTCENSAPEVADRGLTSLVSNLYTVLPPYPRKLFGRIEIDDLQSSPTVKVSQTACDSLYIGRGLDVEACFLGQVDVLGASLSSDLVLEARGGNWSETLCQPILDGMNKFDGYENKSS